VQHPENLKAIAVIAESDEVIAEPQTKLWRLNIGQPLYVTIPVAA
jgi:hypothetical protein